MNMPQMSNMADGLKIFIGLGKDTPAGYEAVDISSDYNINSVRNIDNRFSLNSAISVLLKYAFEKLSFYEIENLIQKLSVIAKNNCELIIYYNDISNLIKNYDKSKISITQLNDIIYKSKSVIDRNSLIQLLNKYDFDITGFEFEDKNSWDDYRCIIKSKINKNEDVKQENFQTRENTFSGINFDINNSNDENDIDEDLFSEVMSMTSPPDTIDSDLFDEVMNFSPEAMTYKEFNRRRKQKEAMESGGINYEYNEPATHNENIHNRFQNFSINDFNSDDEKQEDEIDDDLYNEIMNFKFDEESKSEDNSFIDEVLNFSNEKINKSYLESNLESKKEYGLDFDKPTSFQQNYGRQFAAKELNKEDKMNNPSINIVWEGTQFVYNPLAHVNREICSGLLDAEVANVTLVPYEADDPNFNRYDTNPKLLENDIRQKKDVPSHIAKLPYTWIRHQFPPKAEPPKGAKWIIMQPWEFSQLREDMKEVLSRADEVWTPSFYSRKAMVESGIDFNKVQVIPNGVNPNIFKPTGDKFHLPTRKKFKFLFVGGTIYRKGFDILLKAYLEAFNYEDDVCLVVKEHGADTFYRGMTSEKQIESAKYKYNSPEIIYIDENLTTEQMASLYRACDVIVAPYRAESFCLPLLEGVACGLPAIATKGGASDDYLEEAFASLISAEKVSIGNRIDNMPLTGNAYLLEPSYEELKDKMLYYYSNPGNTVSMGAVGSAYARTKWDWNKSVIKILRRLDYHYGTKMSAQAESNISDVYDGCTIFGTAEHTYIEGDYDNAVDLYMQAIKSDVPDKYKILGMHRIAMILINKGEYFAASDILDSVSNMEYNHPDSQYLKVIIAASQNKTTDALDAISPLMDDWKDYKFDSNLGHHLDDLLVLTGDLLLSMNDIEAAHSLYSTALSINSENSYACYGAGMCFKLSDLTEQAKEMFEWAVKLNPNFEDAQKQLDEVYY